VFEGVGEILDDIVSNVGELDFVGLVSDLVTDIGTLVGDVIGDSANIVADVLEDAGNLFVEVASDVAETLANITNSVANALVDIAAEVAETLADLYVDVFVMIKELVLDLGGILITFGECLGGRLGYFYVKRGVQVGNVGKSKHGIPESLIPTFQPLYLTLDLSGIRFVDGARLPANWFSSKDETAGMTFGFTIYLRDKFDPSRAASVNVLAHELVHCNQVVRFGGESNFACEYGKGYAKAGFKYRENPLEDEAYTFADSHFPY